MGCTTQVQFPAGTEILLIAITSGLAVGPTQLPGALSLECEADHSPPSRLEVKNAWRYTSTPPYIFMAWCLIKHRDFAFSPLIETELIEQVGSSGNSSHLYLGTAWFKSRPGY
jgi:hypothetical protein